MMTAHLMYAQWERLLIGTVQGQSVLDRYLLSTKYTHKIQRSKQIRWQSGLIIQTAVSRQRPVSAMIDNGRGRGKQRSRYRERVCESKACWALD